MILNQSVQQCIQGPHRALDTEFRNGNECSEGEFGPAHDAVIANEGDEEVFAAPEIGVAEVGEEWVDVLKSAGAREAADDGVVGVVIMGKSGVVFAGVVENLEGEVEFGFASDEGDEALWVEALGPVFDRRGDGAGLEEIDGGGGGGEADGGD